MNKNEAKPRRKVVMLTLTENCNLSCVYCFEKAKTKKVMDIQIAKDAIKFEFQNSEGFDEIEIDLFGGEPTLCIDVIKELVEWTYNQSFSKPYIFFLETNGTLVHGEFQKWLQSNKEYVRAGISLDGTPETHNKNRSNSYKDIDIDFFRKTYPNQSVRMTINSKTINNLSNDIIHLHDLGFEEVIATFAFGIDWDLNNVKHFLIIELEKLCDFYLEHPELKECSIFDMDLSKVLQKDKSIEKWCGTGTSMISYAIDGSKYPCQVFQPNTLPEFQAKNLCEIDIRQITDFCDPECSTCKIESICPTCYGMNYIQTGNFLTKDKQLCEIVKIRAMATSYLRAKQIEIGIKKFSPNVMFQTIEAIKMIQNTF